MATGRTIGFPRESTDGDRRTLLTPLVATHLRVAGFRVLAESKIGAGVFLDDEEYRAAGVEFAPASDVWACPLVLRHKMPHPADVARLAPGQAVGALFHAEGNPAMLAALRASKVRAWSYEFFADEDGFPLARPGGHIAGVLAVLHGAYHLQSAQGGRGVLLAAVPGADAAQVLVIGHGNVGGAAAATAARLGAEVTVLARGEESAVRYAENAPAGVRVLVNTPAMLRDCLREADLVIGAILISTYDTAPMITDEDLLLMRSGSVIVDATCGYGPGYLPTAGPVQWPGASPRTVRGVLHVKVDVLPQLVPVTAVQAYTATAAPYVVRLAKVAFGGDADPVIAAGLIAADGDLMHPVLREHAAHYGTAS